MARTHAARLDTALWTAQILLAATFAASGLLKAFVPAADLQRGFGLFADAQAGILHPVGLVELGLCLGLILPAGARIVPRLTPFAAICLGAIALLGAVQPTTAGGLGLLLPNLALVAGSTFVAWGRLVVAPIEPATFGPEPDVADPFAAARLERNRRRHAAAARRLREVA
jgi:hypothetical protein